MKPHVVPLHVATPFAGGTQGVHEVPQVAVLALETQVSAQAWKPVSHVKPHFVPLQVAVLFPGGRHAEQDVPQVAMLELETQRVPHR